MTAFSDETGRDALSVLCGVIADFENDPRTLYPDNEVLLALEKVKSALSASPVAQEPVAWRWQENGWGDYWVYNPEPGWLAEQNNIVKQPLYTSPPATPAGLGADEIARIIERNAHSISKPIYFKERMILAMQVANAILALLSRAGGSEVTHLRMPTQQQNI